MDPHDDEAPKDPRVEKLKQSFGELDFEERTASLSVSTLQQTEDIHIVIRNITKILKETNRLLKRRGQVN
ncbi:hypothetical protein HUJ05_003661 [Dendroctonus ponderosae]|nr:hypothetical protein HUJ05_003661 [Dendroctonus ponderosae]